MSVEGNAFGSQANYSCSEGYVLNGNSTRMCQADGQWSGSEPTCEGQNLSCVDVCGAWLHACFECVCVCVCVYVCVGGGVNTCACEGGIFLLLIRE